MQISKRELLFSCGAVAIASGTVFRVLQPSKAQAATLFPITKSDAQWRTLLSAKQYAVLRESATEYPGSSPLNKEERTGIYVCAGCENRLFSSRHKYDSGTGWPSFWQPLPDAVGQKTDYGIGYPRTEIHCADCGGHLGHVFSDGPRPTGKRYCMNGDAMLFWVNNLVD